MTEQKKIMSPLKARLFSLLAIPGDRCHCHGFLREIVPPHDCFTILAWPRAYAVELYGEEWVRVLG